MKNVRTALTGIAAAAVTFVCGAGAISAQEAQSAPEADCSDCATSGGQETDGLVLGGADRVLKHQSAIEFYWEQMGITLPQDRARSAKAINEMSKEEFQHLLDGIETIGGPKSVQL